MLSQIRGVDLWESCIKNGQWKTCQHSTFCFDILCFVLGWFVGSWFGSAGALLSPPCDVLRLITWEGQHYVAWLRWRSPWKGCGLQRFHFRLLESAAELLAKFHVWAQAPNAGCGLWPWVRFGREVTNQITNESNSWAMSAEHGVLVEYNQLLPCLATGWADELTDELVQFWPTLLRLTPDHPPGGWLLSWTMCISSARCLMLQLSFPSINHLRMQLTNGYKCSQSHDFTLLTNVNSIALPWMNHS